MVKHFSCIVLALATVTLPWHAAAQSSGAKTAPAVTAAGPEANAPASVPSSVAGAAASTENAPKVQVEGFRSAKFGMDDAAVRAAIKSDFSLEGDAIAEGDNRVERTRILSVKVPSVLDGGGTAEVSYVFGYASKTLSQVSVVWSSETDTALTPAQLLSNAGILQNYFLSGGYDPKTMVTGAAIPEGLLMFRGTDGEGRMTVQILRGSFAVGENQQQPVLTPTSLLVAYLANPDKPDVFTV